MENRLLLIPLNELIDHEKSFVFIKRVLSFVIFERYMMIISSFVYVIFVVSFRWVEKLTLNHTLVHTIIFFTQKIIDSLSFTFALLSLFDSQFLNFLSLSLWLALFYFYFTFTCILNRTSLLRLLSLINSFLLLFTNPYSVFHFRHVIFCFFPASLRTPIFPSFQCFTFPSSFFLFFPLFFHFVIVHIPILTFTL